MMTTTITCATPKKPRPDLAAAAAKIVAKHNGTGNTAVDALNAQMPDIPNSLKRAPDTRTPAQRAAAVAKIKGGGKGGGDTSNGGNLRLPRNIEPAGRQILKEQLKMKEAKKADRLRALRESKADAKPVRKAAAKPAPAKKDTPVLVPGDAVKLSELGVSLADLKKSTTKAGLYLWGDPDAAVYATTETHEAPGETFDLIVMPPAAAKDKRRKANGVEPKVEPKAKAAAQKAEKKPAKPRAEKKDAPELRPDGLKKGSAMALLVDTVCRKQGATHDELCKTVDWKQCLPAMLKACEKAGVTLRKEKKEGQHIRYFGTPAH